MSQLYILDLDRTIFNTDLFLTDLLTILQNDRGIDPETFRSRIADYRQGEFYNFYGQVEAMAGLNATGLDSLVRDQLANRSYLYPDVVPWLRQRSAAGEVAAIVTVGQEPFQQLKLRHAPALDSLSQTIVPTNKGALMSQQLQSISKTLYRLTFIPGEYTAIHLVDDNPATFDALGLDTPIATYHMARAGEIYTASPTPAGTQRITSLAQLK